MVVNVDKFIRGIIKNNILELLKDDLKNKENIINKIFTIIITKVNIEILNKLIEYLLDDFEKFCSVKNIEHCTKFESIQLFKWYTVSKVMTFLQNYNTIDELNKLENKCLDETKDVHPLKVNLLQINIYILKSLKLIKKIYRLSSPNQRRLSKQRSSPKRGKVSSPKRGKVSSPNQRRLSKQRSSPKRGSSSKQLQLDSDTLKCMTLLRDKGINNQTFEKFLHSQK